MAVITGSDAVIYLPGGEAIEVKNFQIEFAPLEGFPVDRTISGDNIEIVASE